MGKLSKHHRVCAGAGILAFALNCGTALSQQPDQLSVVQRIYSGLARQFASSPDEMLILFDPGVAIDAWTDPNSDLLQRRFLMMSDEGLKPQPIRATTTAKVSATYEQILRNGMWGKLILDSSEQQQLSDANKILYKDASQKTPTTGYAQYLQLQDRYTKAQAAWDATPEDKRTEKMRAELDAASRDLDLRGNAPHYQGALETLATLSATEPSHLSRMLKKVQQPVTY